jgi:LEA14-like dessication related protein
MMVILRLVLFCLLLSLAVSGCSALIQEPRVSVKQTSLIAIDTSGVDIEFFLEVNNPNPFDLSLMSYTYDLRIMTLPLANGGNQDVVLFPAGSGTNLRMPIHLKFADLLEIIKRRPDPDRIPYRIDARLNLETPLGEMIIPVSQQASLSIPPAYRPGVFINNLRDALKTLH